MDTPPVVTPPPPLLLTVGAIARELGQPVHRVKYHIDAHAIGHVQRAGVLRLFSRDVLPRIHAALSHPANAKRREATDAR